MVWPTLGLRTAKEQNRTEHRLVFECHSLFLQLVIRLFWSARVFFSVLLFTLVAFSESVMHPCFCLSVCLSVCLSGCLTRRVHTPSDSQGAALTWPAYVSALLPECCHKQVISSWKCVRNNDTVEMENYKKITCGLSKRAISDDLE